MRNIWKGRVREILIMIIIAFAASSHHTLHPWNQFINSDGKGYYGYLPAVFIYNDNTFGFIDSYELKYYVKESYADFREDYKDVKVNKCFSGVALVLLPFFLIAHFAASVLGLAADGYSPIYQYSVLAAAIFYLYMGMYFTQKILQSFNLGYRSISLTIILIGLGTNLFYYTVYAPSMSHVYSFFSISMFAYAIVKLSRKVTPSGMYIAAVALGITLLIRPTNLLVLLMIPFLAGSYEALLKMLKGILYSIKPLVISAFIVVAIVSIQSILWYWQSGYFIIRPYGDEGLNFLDPKFFHVLFSYRKGLFIYTPLLFFSMAGFYFLYKQGRFRAIWLFLFLIFLVYFISSWWHWPYGMSFGHRGFIDFFVLFAVLLALAIENFKFNMKFVFIGLCSFALFFNQLQTYQYTRFILLWDGMTKDHYWQVFMKTAYKYEGLLWKDLYGTTKKEFPETSDLLFKASTNFESPHELWDNKPLTEKYSYSGRFSTLTNLDIPYSASFELPLNDINLHGLTLLEINSKVYYERIRNNTQLVVKIESDGHMVYYEPVRLNSLVKVPRKWEDLNHRLLLPELSLAKNHVLKIYAFNNEKKKPVYFDDMEIKLYSVVNP